MIFDSAIKAAILCSIFWSNLCVAISDPIFPRSSISITKTNYELRFSCTSLDGSGCISIPASFPNVGEQIVGVVYYRPKPGIAASFSIRDDAGNAYLLYPPFADETWAQFSFSAVVNGPISTLLICISKCDGDLTLSGLSLAGTTGVDGGKTTADPRNPGPGSFVGGPADPTCISDAALISFVNSPGFDVAGRIDMPVEYTAIFQSATRQNYVTLFPVSQFTTYFVKGNFAGGWAASSLIVKGQSCKTVVQPVNTTVDAGQTVTVIGTVEVSAPVVSGTLVVEGNVSFVATTSVTSTAVVQVTGDVSFDAQASLVVIQGSQISVNGTLLANNATVSMEITSYAPTVVITVASYSQISGNFRLNPPSYSAGIPSGFCDVVLSNPTPNYGSTALTVTVSINTVTCAPTTSTNNGNGATTTNANSSPLSTAAIIGIAVGGGVALIAVIVVITVLIVRHRSEKQMWSNVQEKVKMHTVTD